MRKTRSRSSGGAELTSFQKREIAAFRRHLRLLPSGTFPVNVLPVIGIVYDGLRPVRVTWTQQHKSNIGTRQFADGVFVPLKGRVSYLRALRARRAMRPAPRRGRAKRSRA